MPAGATYQTDLVSIIVPAYNAEATIEETLLSACAQTHSLIEIIVVDDGSTDRTVEIITRIAKSDDRVRLLRQANGGVACARNNGLANARGKWIAPLDADDVWHPHKLARQLGCLSNDGEAGVVYCSSYDIDENSIVINRRLDQGLYEGWVTPALVVNNFLGNSSTPLLRYDLIVSVGGWDSGLRAHGAQGCEDWLLYLSLSQLTRFVVEPAFLVGYRQTRGAMSRDVGQMRRSHRLVMAWVKARCPNLPRRLVRWSHAEFAHYTAEILRSEGKHQRAILRDLAALRNEPRWILSRSSWRSMVASPRKPACTAASAPVGLPFRSAPIECDLRPALPYYTRRQLRCIQPLLLLPGDHGTIVNGFR